MQQLWRQIILFSRPLAWLAVISFLCLMPAEDLPRVSLFSVPHFDKLVHFGMYFVLAVLLSRPLTRQGLPGWITVMLITLLAGGLIELLQLVLSSYRSASVTDLLADLAGAVAGLLAYRLFIRGRKWEKYF